MQEVQKVYLFAKGIHPSHLAMLFIHQHGNYVVSYPRQG